MVSERKAAPAQKKLKAKAMARALADTSSELQSAALPAPSGQFAITSGDDKEIAKDLKSASVASVVEQFLAGSSSVTPPRYSKHKDWIPLRTKIYLDFCDFISKQGTNAVTEHALVW